MEHFALGMAGTRKPDAVIMELNFSAKIASKNSDVVSITKIACRVALANFPTVFRNPSQMGLVSLLSINSIIVPLRVELRLLVLCTKMNIDLFGNTVTERNHLLFSHDDLNPKVLNKFAKFSSNKTCSI